MERIDDKQFADLINAATGLRLSEFDVRDALWAIYVDNNLMLELNRRHLEWRREMEETHPDE